MVLLFYEQQITPGNWELRAVILAPNMDPILLQDTKAMALAVVTVDGNVVRVEASHNFLTTDIFASAGSDKGRDVLKRLGLAAQQNVISRELQLAVPLPWAPQERKMFNGATVIVAGDGTLPAELAEILQCLVETDKVQVVQQNGIPPAALCGGVHHRLPIERKAEA